MKFNFKLLMLIFLSSILISYVYPTTVANLTLKDLTLKADDIIIGKCTDKKSQWVGSRIETTIKIKVSEVIKGKKAAGEEVEITQIGGELSQPIPIGQYVPGMPQFYTGEETLLFLSTKRPELSESTKQRQNPKSKLVTSPYVVGLAQGKYTIIADKKTGTKYAVRYNVENLGLVPNDEINKKMEKAISEEKPLRNKANPASEKVAATHPKIENTKENTEKTDLKNIEQQNNQRTLSDKSTLSFPEDNKSLNVKKELKSFKEEINGYLNK